MKDAILYLEDGKSFQGRSLAVSGESAGEVVFNTAMSGYQEILTDPSYAGQIVVMTYPLIGNYGVNEEDVESAKVHVKGFVVKEFCRRPSNYRATQGLMEYLNENRILAVEGIDTRALTRHIRDKGAMRGLISTEDFDPDSLSRKIQEAPPMEGSDWVKEVTCAEPCVWPARRTKRYVVAALDCGIKWTIIRILNDLGCEVHLLPASTPAEEILALNPDGIFVSNGPGDPEPVTYVVETLRSLLGKRPLFGICLGNQLLGLALGGRTYKLKFGHHGANHPVWDKEKDVVSITSQNHGFCVDVKSLPEDEVEIIHWNLNDQTVEGLRHKRWPIFSVQYHPEAAPGPHDARYLFQSFLELMDQGSSDASSNGH